MPRSVREIVGSLDGMLLDGDFMPLLYAVADELEVHPEREDAVVPVLTFIERHATADLGLPGPLVHFLETVPGYERAVLQSVRAQPTFLTIWMLNRILNVVDEDDARRPYIEALEATLDRQDVDQGARRAAEQALRHQARREA